MKDTIWLYNAPLEGGGNEIVRTSEDEIRRLYYPWWTKQMWKAGKQDQITFESCLEDWVTIHWAWLEDKEEEV